MSGKSSETPKQNRLREEAARQQRRRRTLLWLSLPLLVILGGLYVRSLFLPATQVAHLRRVHIPEGAGAMGIGRALANAGVVRSPYAFVVYARLYGEAGRLKAGRYRLSGDQTLGQILRALERGPSRSDADVGRVTVPEGYTLRQIAGLLSRKGVADGSRFLRLARDPAVISRLPVDFPLPEASLEGYLFPDTYDFAPGITAEQVIDEMMLNFSRRFARPNQQQINVTGRSLHEIVTIASLIEREAKEPQDRARIAGVLENRLKRGMKLQVDATVEYALPEYKESLSLADLQVKSPYNTYRFKGLPPGPIANPGRDSLEAAVHPEQNDFLYYVARPNHTHLFTRTFAEHEKAIREVKAEWRRLRGGQGG